MAKTGVKPRPISERFWNRVKIGKKDECWQWLGCLNNGYGRVNIGDHQVDYAHRVAYELYYGKIPAELFVLHKCDNRVCVNPHHLFVGTHQDNVDDMVSKRRHAHGARARHAVLDETKVRKILERYARGAKITDLSIKFSVSWTTIYHIVRRETWAHVERLVADGR